MNQEINVHVDKGVREFIYMYRNFRLINQYKLVETNGSWIGLEQKRWKQANKRKTVGESDHNFIKKKKRN